MIKIPDFLIPNSLRKKIEKHKLKKKIINYYSSFPLAQLTKEHLEVITYLKKSALSKFPYKFKKKYNKEGIEVFYDKDLNLRYVIWESKKLYIRNFFKDSVKKEEEKIRNLYKALQVEQDIESPHRYLTDRFNVEEGEVVVDIGAAEGNFALSVIENAGKIYLFETDNNWLKALEATFAPWDNKVEIINKFISNKNDDKTTTLDDYFSDKKVDFLKIDVEGEEFNVLKGCEKILSSKRKLKIAICTYHRQEDETILTELLKSKGFKISYSKGYMIPHGSAINKSENIISEFNPPYLRRGLIRAIRS